MTMKNDYDFIQFKDENISSGTFNARLSYKPWKIIIVDDEPAIHEVTKLALNDFEFDGRQLEFIDCYTGAEAIASIKEHDDAAVMLLDVVMEDEYAGLNVVREIREVIENKNLRIILRTGQPGQAPEREIICQYDINDYKEKTELTSQKLFSVIYTSLRSYRDINTIYHNKIGLERVIRASANIFELKTFRDFTAGVLEQLTSLLRADPAAVYVQSNGLAASLQDNCISIVAGTGIFESCVGHRAEDVLDSGLISELKQAISSREPKITDDRYIGYFESKTSKANVLCVTGIGRLDAVDFKLIALFNTNLSIAFDNFYLHRDIEETQREIVYLLGDAVEVRSSETGSHVKRVAEISKLLAIEYGLDEDTAELIRLASPLHDVGKIAIPDAILNKPGKLTEEEWAIMQTHALQGYEMLKNSKRPILQTAAIIAHQHHEKWDGSGYPSGLSGEDIHIFGRITALADVFDALSNKRCYKEAWPASEILKFLKDQREKHFDPRLVDILIENMGLAISINKRYSDKSIS